MRRLCKHGAEDPELTTMNPVQPAKDQRATVPDFRVLFESAPAALLVILPDAPIFTMVAVSENYLRVNGAKREDLLGRGIFGVFPDNPEDPSATGVRNLRDSFQRAITSRAPDRLALLRYDAERSLTKGGGFVERYWSALNTPVLGGDGSVEYILHSVEEVTEKVRAEQAAQAALQDLQTGEERFRQLAEASTLGLIIADLEGGISYLNPTVRELLGYTENEVVAGLVRWDQLTPPEYAPLDAEAVHQLTTTGRCAPFEKAYIAKDGRRVPILLGASVLARVDGRTEVAAFILDLTERKQSQRDAFLVRLDDSTRPLVEPDEIMETVARLLGEHLGVDRCSYCMFEADGETFAVTQEYTRGGLSSMVGLYTLGMFGPDVAQSIRADAAAVEEDIENNPRAIGVLPLFRRTKNRSFIAVPLFKGGRIVSAIAVHQQTPRRWLPQEVELVKLVANRCWETIERARSARAFQESERRLRLAQKAGRTGSFEWLTKENRVIWTPELEALYGLPEGSFEGGLDDWKKRVVPEDAERVLAQIDRCIALREADCAYEFRAVLPEGTQRWLRGQALFFYDEAGVPERMIGINIDIDARKRAEANLHQQWHKFDTVLSNTPDFAYTFDLEGRFTYVNRALLSLWQIPLEQALGRNFFELDYPPELAERLQRQIQEVIDTKAQLRDQTPFRALTGEVGQYEYIFVPVLAADGQVEAVAGSTREITEQKKAEELIEEDRGRWRELLLQAPAAIAVLRGPEHRFEWVNADYTRLVGRSAELLIGRTVPEAIPEVISQGYIGLLDRVYQGGEPHIAREALLRLGTSVLKDIYINFVYLPTRDSQGQIDGVFLHATDVTDLVLARKRVEEGQERYRFLAESIPQMVWTATPDGALDYVSEQVAAYFGMSHEALLGAGWLVGVHPDDYSRVVERWVHSLTTGEPYETEFRLRRGDDGAWRWFLVRARSMPAAEDRVLSWVGTCTDIHDQKESEAALRKANRELEEFAYVASHDLQEPLRMVNIYTQLILRHVRGEDRKLSDFADFVRQGVARMEVLIHDLLTFSRTVHTEQLPSGAADLTVALTEALSVLKNRIEENGAVITSPALPEVRADTGQMAHVFQNLLSNALKYRKLDVAPKIHISLEQEGEEWIVSVRDNGIGFEQQYAARIFGLFKRLHKEEYPGTGLGLAICQRIVERYGGRMWAEGRPGVGATFSFALPRV